MTLEVVDSRGRGRRHNSDSEARESERPTRALLSAIFQGKLVPHEIHLLLLPPHFSFLPWTEIPMVFYDGLGDLISLLVIS